jgi:hypothetical protein
MNVDTLEALADVVRTIDRVTCEHSLTLSGTVLLGDAGGEASLGTISFNDGSETTLVGVTS